MLDEKVIAPRNTLPDSFEASQPFPVFLAQANFITGGLILTFNGEHNAMDMTGQAFLMRLLSKACHDGQFTGEEIASGNASRCDIFPLLGDSYKEGPELFHSIEKPRPITGDLSKPPSVQPELDHPPKCTWTYFAFSSASLATLKSRATADVISPPGYISTDDAVSAFIWQSVLRARLPRLEVTAKTTFARAIDVRRYLGLSPTYPGLAQNMTYHTYTVGKLIQAPLGVVASQLRLAVDPKTSDLGFRTRALATFLTRIPDKSIVSFTATIDTSSDVMFSSWSKENCYELDFNLGLGTPEAVRRPQFDPVESLMYLMPKRQDGDIALAICLRDEDMERLKIDNEFLTYARYIGGHEK